MYISEIYFKSCWSRSAPFLLYCLSEIYIRTVYDILVGYRQHKKRGRLTYTVLYGEGLFLPDKVVAHKKNLNCSSGLKELD